MTNRTRRPLVEPNRCANRGWRLKLFGGASRMWSQHQGRTMVQRVWLLLSTFCLITALTIIAWPFIVQGRSGGYCAPEGPFQRLTGEFQYDYKRYAAVGKDWKSSCTREMPYSAVDAHVNPENGRDGWPAVEFIVWFLGPMKSDNPKCTFDISDGGEVKALKAVTRHHLNIIAVPRVSNGLETHGFSNLQSNTPWTIRFNCTSE